MGLRFPDRMIGGLESGRLTRVWLWPLIEDLPDGITELVVHPVEGGAELAALLDPELLTLPRRRGCGEDRVL